MAGYYPPPGFHFRVEVLGLPPKDNDIRFSEVAGLSREVTTEEVAEGGENRFIQKYPGRTKYPDLTLKRGLLMGSEVRNWMKKAIADQVIEPKNVDIMLLDEGHDPLMTWHVIGAYPTKWAVSDLNASTNAIVVETLRLAYQFFTLDPS